jgi:hypothetical protein
VSDREEDGVPIAITDEQLALTASIRERAQRAAAIDAVRAQELLDLGLAVPAGAAEDGNAAALVNEFLLTRCLSIAGGSTQILLSMIAEWLLRLPREEAR